MILSRRSFLKVAGLSAVAVAGASMFTGCSFNNLFSTGVVYSAKAGSGIDADLIEKLNKSNFANAVPGHSDLYSDPDKCKEAVQNQLNGAAKLNVEAAKNVEVDSATIDYKRNDKGEIVKENGKEVYVIKAVLKKKTTSTNG